MKAYKTITSTVADSFTEKKSDFIGVVNPVDSEQSAVDFIAEVRANHRKSRHNCYAYVADFNERFSDDGEPSGTAGMPILEVLRNNQLNNIVCIVTRYFGGVLLGAGGLTRAYSKAAALAVKAAQTQGKIVTMSPARKINIIADYSMYGRINAAVAELGGVVENAEFSEKIEIEAVLPVEIQDFFKEKVIDLCCGAVSVEFSQKLCYNFGKNS